MRLDLNHLKERVACQHAIMDRVLDDLCDVNGELKTMVDDLPSADFFLLQPVPLLCAKCRTPYAVIDPDPCLWYRRYVCRCKHVSCLAGLKVCECFDCVTDRKRYQPKGSKN